MRTEAGLQILAALALSSMLTLWPLQAGAEEPDARLVSREHATARVASCRMEPYSPWYYPSRAVKMACEWHAELRSAVASVRDDWGYQTGLTLFVAGNALTFSFPLLAALGADVFTITSVIITGEVVEVVGIFLLGEEALHDLRRTFGSITAELRSQFDRLRSTPLPEWSWPPSWRWSPAESLPPAWS